MGWLAKLTNWLSQQIHAFWDALVAFFGDLVIKTVEAVCDFFLMAINAIPVPDFLTTYSMNGLLSSAGPTIGWLVGTFKIGECLSIIAAGFAFRLLRKLLTLGQW